MNYYYLISSLPEVHPLMEASTLDYDELFDSIKRNLNNKDSQLYRYLIYPNDLHNLLSVLSQEYQNWSSVNFKSPSVFDKEDIKAYRKNRRNFPDFMNDFLSENEDRLGSMSRREMEDAMQNRFYNEVFEINNTFLTTYYKFIRELKSLTAAYNFNTYDFLTQPSIQDAERLILQVGPDRSPSASVLKDYAFLEELMTTLAEHQPEKTERLIDRIIWGFLDESTGEHFSREVVFAYAIKLKILKRWLSLEPENDNKEFNRLVQEITNNYTSEKTLLL